MTAWTLVGLALLPAAAAKSTDKDRGASCWVDPDTPKTAATTTDSRKDSHHLIFSDEFNEAGREFRNGRDERWTALEIGDTSNKGAAFYLPEQASIATDTVDPDRPVSALLISTEDAPHTGDSPTGEKGITMPYKSAMLQTWNKFCFTGGIVEFRARQPRGAGYWPALWLFGNLGRAVYQNSNTGLWPWSYDECDDDLRLAPTSPPQRISACMNQDTKSGLKAYQGRGATEIDILEGAVTNDGKMSYVVGSLQLSPSIPPFFRPQGWGAYPSKEGPGSWYRGITLGQDDGKKDSHAGSINNGWYGPPWGEECPTGCPDALSAGFTGLDTLDTQYWTYRMEWSTGPKGHLSWFYNDEFVWGMDHTTFGAYKVCADRGGEQDCSRTPPRMAPQEPMSLIMNTAIGTWNGGAAALDNTHWPALFYIDYVRVWQKETNIGCNPPDFPTKEYIERNAELYGEPVLPSGYDTCPEIYPQSAHENAKALAARAEKIKAHGGDVKAARAVLDGQEAVATSTVDESARAAASRAFIQLAKHKPKGHKHEHEHETGSPATDSPAPSPDDPLAPPPDVSVPSTTSLMASPSLASPSASDSSSIRSGAVAGLMGLAALGLVGVGVVATARGRALSSLDGYWPSATNTLLPTEDRGEPEYSEYGNMRIH